MDAPFHDSYDIQSLDVYCVRKILSYCQTIWTVKLFASSSSLVNLGLQGKPDSGKVMDGRGYLSSVNQITNCVRLKSEKLTIPQPSKFSTCLTPADRNTMGADNHSVCFAVALLNRTALSPLRSGVSSPVIDHFCQRETFFGGLVRYLYTESQQKFVHNQQSSLSLFHCKAYPYAMFMMACFNYANRGEQVDCCRCSSLHLELGTLTLANSLSRDCVCSQQVLAEVCQPSTKYTGMCLQSDFIEEIPSEDEVCSESRLDSGLPEERDALMASCCVNFNGNAENVEVTDISELCGMNGSDDSDAGYVEMSAETDPECQKTMIDLFNPTHNPESSMASFGSSEIIFVDAPCKSCEESEYDAGWSGDDDDDANCDDYDEDSDSDSNCETDSSTEELMTVRNEKLSCVNAMNTTHSKTTSKTGSSVCSFFIRGSALDTEESSSSSEEKDDVSQDDCDSGEDDDEEDWSSDEDQEDLLCLTDLDPFQVSGLYVPPASTSLVVCPKLCSMSSPKKVDESHETDDISPLKLINNKWNLVYGGLKQAATCRVKKVSFDETAPAQIPVLNENQWAEDYRNARISFWEELARDRFRFQRRIAETAGQIEWVLKPEHRDRISSTHLV